MVMEFVAIRGDLFLKNRVQDHRGSAGVFQFPDVVDSVA